MALTICTKCKRSWQANSGAEPCPWCRAETAEAKLQAYESHGPDGHNVSNAQYQAVADKLQAAEAALREIYNGLVEINPNNHDEDDVFTQNNSVIESIHIADAILAGHAPAPTPQAKVRIA